MSARLHQATCVAIEGRGLLIEGTPGCGKSSLALALIDRGARLVGDDGVSLEAQGGRLLVSPAPATAGLLEVRNVGLVEFPAIGPVPACLLLRLDEAAPRYVEEAEQAELAGVILPMLRLWPGGAVLHLRAELALERYGLP